MSICPIVNEAWRVAHAAHAGQVDKAGRPYIEHVARVALAVEGDDEAEAVAWLHDVLEDCPAYAHLVVKFPPIIAEAVLDLTRTRFGDASYYWNIRRNSLALKVKLADIADNSDEARLALLDPATAERLRIKYAKARAALGVGA
ncbi:HD domain-containing protein [Stenotrophomonas chelatiphaga]|uniref:HD domain-containing protein n=1 Tax=Stenotrophomonas chelatiphaga TaxID=517011 RepID=UPI0028997849|nr:HD domain-containing protein [Stenotrophomonas chelatiphaga]